MPGATSCQSRLQARNRQIARQESSGVLPANHQVLLRCPITSDCLDAEVLHRTPSSSSRETSSWGCDGGARRYACSAWNWLPCSILSQTSRFLPYPCNNAPDDPSKPQRSSVFRIPGLLAHLLKTLLPNRIGLYF